MTHSIGPWPGDRINGARDGVGVPGLLRLAKESVLVAMLAASGMAAAQVPLDLSTTQTQLRDTSAPLAATAAPDKPAPDSRPRKFEGAITSVASWGPDYLGAKNYGWSLQPGLLLRYGRWSISSNGSFAARTNDPNDAPRGLGLNLLGDEHDWVKLSLRVDSGRRSKGVDALRGVDDVPRTLRLRLSARKEWSDGWVITPGVNVDLLNKGVGHTADLSVGKDWNLSAKLKWSASMGATWASGGYMRSYFGITPGESAASGYSIYEPGAGLRDVRLGTALRYEFNRRWVVVAHASVQKLVGQAASSPTTQATTQWGIGAGLGWRF
jgi:outer membrane scaffolding protein for murein synthesis (MipA/OmpV family)